jgi:hypothetical protein
MPGLENVLGNLKGCEDRMRAALHALGMQTAAQMEAYAKQNAPWEDQTGNARQGLFGEVAEADGKLKVRIAHTVEYGVYLELSRKGRRPILEPTAQKFAPEFFEAAKGLLDK